MPISFNFNFSKMRKKSAQRALLQKMAEKNPDIFSEMGIDSGNINKYGMDDIVNAVGIQDTIQDIQARQAYEQATGGASQTIPSNPIINQPIQGSVDSQAAFEQYRQSPLSVTKRTITPTGGTVTVEENPDVKAARDVRTAQQKKGVERREKGIGELGDKFGEGARILQGLRNLIGYGRAMDESGLSTTERQAMSKVSGVVPYLPEDKQDRYGPLLNYVAQMEETKIGALPILSGQARYVVDLARAIQKTIAAPGFKTSIREDLTAQSARNMMSLIYGIQNGQLSAENLSNAGIDPNSPVQLGEKGELPTEARALLDSVKLTKEQEKLIGEGIDYVLGAKALKKGKFVEDDDSELLKNMGVNADEWEIAR